MKKKYLKITGNKFRRTGSINTDILWAGVRRRKGSNTFDPKFFPVLDREITAVHTTDFFNEKTGKAASKAAAKAGIDVADASIGGSVSIESKITGNYSVFTLFDVYDYVDELNSPKNRGRLEMLMREDDPRVITSIATVFNNESSRKISASGNLTLKIINPEFGSPEFTVKAESSGETVAQLSDGTVFAYEYARICWKKKDGTVRVASIAVDRPGMDDDCPDGTKDDASKL